MKRLSMDITELHREQLVDIGQILRNARIEQGLSCEVVSEKALIRTRLLEAMEAADVDALPEPIYTRGLIRQYAKTLGLDGDTLSSQYFTPAQPQPKSSFWRLPITPQLRPLHLYMAYAVLIAIAVSGLSYTLKRAGYSTGSLPPLDDAAVNTAIAEPEASTPADTTSNAAPTPIAEGDVQIAVEMEGQSWLRITADDEVSFEGVLRQGDTRTWTAEEQITIRAGNAGGVKVSFNNAAAEPLGQPGVVKEVSFPPEEPTTVSWVEVP
ncbi:MAG: helix-turn-helix domain-containing protein [Leptolyngbyaceae cyanobacterium]